MEPDRVCLTVYTIGTPAPTIGTQAISSSTSRWLTLRDVDQPFQIFCVTCCVLRQASCQYPPVKSLANLEVGTLVCEAVCKGTPKPVYSTHTDVA